MDADRDDTGADSPMPHPSTRPEGDADAWKRIADDFRELADAVAERTATAAQAEAYGRHLFDALFGPDGRTALDEARTASRWSSSCAGGPDRCTVSSGS